MNIYIYIYSNIAKQCFNTRTNRGKTHCLVCCIGDPKVTSETLSAITSCSNRVNMRAYVWWMDLTQNQRKRTIKRWPSNSNNIYNKHIIVKNTKKCDLNGWWDHLTAGQDAKARTCLDVIRISYLVTVL